MVNIFYLITLWDEMFEKNSYLLCSSYHQYGFEEHNPLFAYENHVNIGSGSISDKEANIIFQNKDIAGGLCGGDPKNVREIPHMSLSELVESTYTLDDMIEAFIAGSNDTIKNRERVIELLKENDLI